MKSVFDCEEYVRKILDIPYVNLSGLDVLICEEIIKTLQEVYKIYPFLKPTLSIIGNKDFLNAYINLNSYADKDLWEEHLSSDGILYSHVFLNIDVLGFGGCIQESYDGQKYQFLGICLGDLLYQNSLDVCNQVFKKFADSKNHPKHATNLRSGIYHEIGHLVDYLFGISSSLEFKNFYKCQKNDLAKKLSKYAMKSEKECLAEAFSEYHSTKYANDITLKVMNYVFDAYKNYFIENKKIQNLNLKRHYKF